MSDQVSVYEESYSTVKAVEGALAVFIESAGEALKDDHSLKHLLTQLQLSSIEALAILKEMQ